MLLGLAVAVVLAEVAFRVLGIEPERHAPMHWLAKDGAGFRESDPWGDGLIKRPSRFAEAGIKMGEYVPGAQFKVAYSSNPRGYFDASNSVLMTVNSLGLRGTDVAAVKPPGTFRILGLGDSFMFGVGVKDGDTFLARLQDKLNTNAPPQRRFETLNAGVQGYNTRDEAICLEFGWLQLQPDLVLICFYINDAYDDATILNNGEGLNIYASKPPGLAQVSKLWDFVQYRYQAHRLAKQTEAFYRQSYFSEARSFLENPSERRVDWKASRAALERVATITRERRLQFGLVMFPELYNLNGNYPFQEIHALVRESCERAGVPFLDLLETFRGRDAQTLWVHPTDHHPNEIAHGLAAAAIESFVREKFLNSSATTNQTLSR